MPVTINGTSGLSGVDGSAGTPAIQGSDTNTGIYFPAADTVAVSVGGTDAFRATPGGNMSITGTMAMGSSFLRNRIINGDMRIDQRNAGASIANTTSNLYSVDRWAIFGSVATKFTAQQNAGSVTPPAGYTHYLGITSSSAYVVGASESFGVRQYVEGLNTADFGFGSASAATITLSFWVRSSLTGNFGGCVYNSGASRIYPFTYSISSANTWEQKTVTIAGDTTGTWLKDTNSGIGVQFSLGAGATVSGTAGAWTASVHLQPTGSTSVVGTNGATWYVTGVQLEAGTVATPFERRLYGQELALCQRYFYKIGGATSIPWANGQISGSGASTAAVFFPVQLRTSASLTIIGTGFNAQDNSAGPFTATIALAAANQTSAQMSYTHSALTGNAARNLVTANSNSFLQFSAEL